MRKVRVRWVFNAWPRPADCVSISSEDRPTEVILRMRRLPEEALLALAVLGIAALYEHDVRVLNEKAVKA